MRLSEKQQPSVFLHAVIMPGCRPGSKLSVTAVPEPMKRQERAASSPLPDIGALILDDGDKVLPLLCFCTVD